MNQAKAILIAASFFKSYPSVNEFHVTSDEQVFEQKHQAESHANTLGKNKDQVLSVVRDEEAKDDATDNSGKVPTKEEMLEAAKKELADATAELGEKQQALTEATSAQKGSRTAAVKKAEDKLAKAKEALESLTAAA